MEEQQQQQFKPSIITINDFLAFKKFTPEMMEPVSGISNLSNINVPPKLQKLKDIDDPDGIKAATISVFNKVAGNNIEDMKVLLRAVFTEKIKTEEQLNVISEEIVIIIMKHSTQINNYIELLNSVNKTCLKVKDNGQEKITRTVGNLFLNYCHRNIMRGLSIINIKNLGKYDQDNDDDLDLYNKAYDKIANLISAVCLLYNQRNTDKLNLRGEQLMSIFQIIVTNCKKLIESLDEEEDDDEYNIIESSILTYVKLTIGLLKNNLEDFKNDSAVVNGMTMNDYITEFKENIIPFVPYRAKGFINSSIESIGL